MNDELKPFMFINQHFDSSYIHHSSFSVHHLKIWQYEKEQFAKQERRQENHAGQSAAEKKVRAYFLILLFRSFLSEAFCFVWVF